MLMQFRKDMIWMEECDSQYIGQTAERMMTLTSSESLKYAKLCKFVKNEKFVRKMCKVVENVQNCAK